MKGRVERRHHVCEVVIDEGFVLEHLLAFELGDGIEREVACVAEQLRELRDEFRCEVGHRGLRPGVVVSDDADRVVDQVTVLGAQASEIFVAVVLPKARRMSWVRSAALTVNSAVYAAYSSE